VSRQLCSGVMALSNVQLHHYYRGIRSAAKVKEMILNGASRVGASGTKSIVAEWGQSTNSEESSAGTGGY
jgi:hypothetical protein